MNRQQFMEECLRLARRGKGHVSPNPLVGAVLVRDGRIIARGYHRKFGGPHAEVECLRKARGNVRKTTLYVNLEPCSYHGKTPPCIDLILSRGIRSVVVAMEDPNPLISGRGIRKLQRAGVRTSVGVLEDEARFLNRVFVTHITARRPYVHVKIAQSSDTRITGGRSHWISSAKSRRLVHAMRAEYDAVLVGAGTVKADDPELTVRMVKGRDPDVVILDGAFSLPLDRKLFAPDQSRRVFYLSTGSAVRTNPGKAKALATHGVTVVALKGTANRLNLRLVLKELYRRNVGSVLVEGGAHVFTQFLAEGLVDEVTLFVSPDVYGKGLAAVQGGPMLSKAGNIPERVRVGKSGRDMKINVHYKQKKS